MPLITFGNISKLKLKIPSKGDTNWAEDFKTYFVDPIVEHDHSGANGKGKQLGAASLQDNAIEARHVNFQLTDLNGILDDPNNPPSEGNYLKFTGGKWQAGSVDPTVKQVTSADPSADGGIGNSSSGIDLSSNSEIYISNVTDADTIDFTARTPSTLVGIKFIIDSATVANKKVKFNNLKDCIIISNLDIEIVGSVDKCIIVMENNDATVNSEGANLTLLSNDTAPNNIVTASKIVSDTIDVNNSTGVDKNLFVDSEIKTKQLNLQLLGGSDNNKSRIIRSNVDVTEKITNATAISSSTGQKLFLEDSKVSFPLFQENVSVSAATYNANTSELNVDDDSQLKQITTNLVKVWKQSANRWNYLVSPSGINKLISADSSGVPSEFSLTQGRLLKAGSTGFENHENIVNNIDDVEITSVQDNQILKYDNSASKWKNVTDISDQIDFGNLAGIDCTTTTSRGNGQLLRVDPKNMRIEDDYPSVPIILDPSCYSFTATESGDDGSNHTHSVTISAPTVGNKSFSIPLFKHDDGGNDLHWETSYAADGSEEIIIKPGELLLLDEVDFKCTGAYGAVIVEYIKWCNDSENEHRTLSEYLGALVNNNSSNISDQLDYSVLSVSGSTEVGTSYSNGASVLTKWNDGATYTGAGGSLVSNGYVYNSNDNATTSFRWQRSNDSDYTDPEFMYHRELGTQAAKYIVATSKWDVSTSGLGQFEGTSYGAQYFPFGGKVYLRFGSSRASGTQGTSGSMKYRIYRVFNPFPGDDS